MNIDELLQSLPSREEIASAVGLHSRSSMGTTDILPALGLFGTGMLFGAGLALLFAPKSGAQMRRALSEKAHEYGTQAREMIEETGVTGSPDRPQVAGQQAAGQQAGQAGQESGRSPYTGSRNI